MFVKIIFVLALAHYIEVNNGVCLKSMFDEFMVKCAVA